MHVAIVVVICRSCTYCSVTLVISQHRQFVQFFINNVMPIKLCFLASSVAMVNFNQGSYTVAENDGQVSVSLRIDGRFFNPVWTIIEISNGTATGGLCMI